MTMNKRSTGWWVVASAVGLLLASGCRDVTGPVTKTPAGLALSAAVVAGPIDTTRTFYGPVTFARGNGAPVTYTDTISTIGFLAPFVLHIRNGDATGSAPLSGATVSLDGVVLMAPTDFKKKKVDYSFKITPGTTTVLQIQLASIDTGYVTAWIDGKEHARFCPVATGDGLGYQSLQTAIDTVTPGHTVWVCNGSHIVNNALVNKPVTIRAENAGMATLVQPATAVATDAILDVNGTVTGKNAIVDLAFQFTQTGMHLHGTFDSVAVIRAAFTGPGAVCPAGGTGLISDATTVTSAHVGVHRSSFTNSCNGLSQNQPVNFDTYNSTFSNFGTFGLLYYSANGGQNPNPTGVATSRPGRVIGNTFTNCGAGACIAIEEVGVDTVSQNQFSMMAGHVNDGIFVNRAGEPTGLAQPVIVTNNVFSGHPLTGPDSVVASWGYSGAIVESPAVGGVTDVIQGNRISGAYAGISARSFSIIAVSDNKIDSTYVPLFQATAVSVVATRNDFSNYVFPIGGGTLGQPVPSVPVLPAGSFTCNWWGGSGGPANMAASVPIAVYAPYSLSRIAGKPAVSCDPLAAVTTVRACATTNGHGFPTMPTIAAAYAAVPSGGTVLICDGSITAALLIQKPVTITAEGPGMPTVDAGGASVIFSVGHVATGPVTISGLRFTGGVNGQVILNSASSVRDGATTNIANNEFHPPSIAAPPGQLWGIYLMNQDSGTVNITGNAFIGGDDGISTGQTPGIVANVTGNSFSGQNYFSIGLGNFDPSATFNISGNSFTDCSTNNACVSSGSRLNVVNNTFNARIAKPLLYAISISILSGDLNPSTISNNTIVGTGHSGSDRYNSAMYPFQSTAIMISGGAATVSGNQITNAFQGIGVWQGAVITATDNVVQTTFAPLSGNGGLNGSGVLTANWNDFSDYLDGLQNVNLLNVSTLNIRCNWWGQASGPIAIDPAAPASSFTPFALVPVAGQAHAGCAP